MTSHCATGPGTLVLVVGPSGAGKDTLIAIARRLVGAQPMIAFPRRTVTRERSAAEEHDSMSCAEFECAVRRGAFAFWWEAHGLKYGLPAALDEDIRAGKTVVCNVSRMIVPRLRQAYVPCLVVSIDAPRHVRAARIQARQRVTDGAASPRIDRDAVSGEALAPDLAINNVGDPNDGGRALADLLRGAAARCWPVTEPAVGA